MVRFSPEQERAIEQKIELFSPIFEKGLQRGEFLRRVGRIRAGITQKRLEWFEKNKSNLDYLKKDDLSDLQKALGLLYGHYMGIFEGITFFPLEDDLGNFYAVHILARNFCPYLEAFRRMDIKPQDSVRLCKLVLEKPCQALVEKVNPHIKKTLSSPHLKRCGLFWVFWMLRKG